MLIERLAGLDTAEGGQSETATQDAQDQCHPLPSGTSAAFTSVTDTAASADSRLSEGRIQSEAVPASADAESGVSSSVSSAAEPGASSIAESSSTNLPALSADFQQLHCRSEDDAQRLEESQSDEAVQGEGPVHGDTRVSKNKGPKKPARNRECPCGSKKRYKNCCGPASSAAERRRVNKSDKEETPVHAMPAIFV